LDTKQSMRLESYFLNAQLFLWGLGGGQKETYKWLELHKISFKREKYERVSSHLKDTIGIWRIIEEIIIPLVRERFPKGTKDYLREKWNNHKLPELFEVNKLTINDNFEELKGKEGVGGQYRLWRPFLEISTQNPTWNYVERWGQLAPIWFLEIEGIFPDAMK